MRVVMDLIGKTALVQHNIRLADKEDVFTKAIAELTSKRKRTEADDAQIAELEWHGGLYHDPIIGIYVPAWNVVRCLEQAGTVTKQGSTVIKALAVVEDNCRLLYEGPRDPKELWKHEEFRWRTSVGVGRSKVTRMRPIFRQWGLRFEAELLEDILDLDDLVSIAETAGRSVGLGDARKLGRGRFEVKVEARR